MTIALTFCIQAVHAEAPTDPPGDYVTSWLGNTYLDKNGMKNVTEELVDICLSPNGKVFSAGYAESGGGGAAYLAADGSFAARYDRFESGFGDPVKAVAADDKFVFWGTPGKGVMKSGLNGGGAGSYTTFLDGKIITGLFVKDRQLYISNYSDGKIHVYDLAAMKEMRSWPCPNPTRLTVDQTGKVWVVKWDSGSAQKPHEGSIWQGEKVVSFSAAGKPGPEITDFEKPLAVAIDNNNQLLVGGLNKHSQIWIYNISGTPKKVGTFGEVDGIFSGTAGAFINTAKLHWIKSIAVDEKGNIYTGCTYGTFWGDCIEKFNPTGALQWRVFAGTSLDCAGIDPENDTEVYSKYHHYSLDYSKSKPGTEWSLKGFTVDRFKYPNDPRIDQNTDVGSRALGWGVRRLGGKLFVGRSSQEGYRFELYRQETSTDGEVLVPSIKMGAGGDVHNHFYNATTKTWYDKPKKDNIYNQYWDIAKNGDLFTIGDPNTIIHYKFEGLDANNNPIWDAAKAVTSVVAEFKPARRLVYDSVADVMYMAGDVEKENWGSFLRVKRFPEWSKGNRTSSFTVTLPYNDAQYAGSSNYGGGTPVGFDVAGDYIFVLYGVGHVRILDKDTGKLVGTLQQNVNGWKGGDGQVDAAYSMTVTKRANGEYIVLFENAAWANIQMYRWRPVAHENAVVEPATYFELRIYDVTAGKLAAVQERFRDAVEPIRQKHGITTLGYWTTSNANGDKFIYLMTGKTKDELQAAEKKFGADPDFQAAYAASNAKYGKTVDKIVSLSLDPADAKLEFTAEKTPRVFELRFYSVPKNKLAAYTARWRDHATRIYARHGLNSIGWWTAPSKEAAGEDTVICLLAGESVESIEKSIKSFHADEEWLRIEKETEQEGKLRTEVTAYKLIPTDFSPLK